MTREHHIVRELAKSSSQEELFVRWNEVSGQLEGSRFVLSAPFGEEQPIPKGHADYEFGGYLRGLFLGERFTFLDSAVWRGMNQLGGARIRLDYSISFDTNAASYARHFVEGLDTPAAQKMRSAFDYLITNRFTYDFNLYYLENFEALVETGDSHEKIRRNLYAIEVLKDLDEEHYLRTGEVRAQAGPRALRRRANELLSQQRNLGDETLEWMLGWYELTYLVLLQIALIEFSHDRRSVVEKLERLLDFFDRDLGGIPIRELSIGAAFLLRGTRESFFGKVQKNHPKLLKTLRNLAWDLQMYRYLEQAHRHNLGYGTHFLPYVLTFDRDLASVWGYYGLQASLVTSEGGYYPLAQINLATVRKEHPKAAPLIYEYTKGEIARKRREREHSPYSLSTLRQKQGVLERKLLRF